MNWLLDRSGMRQLPARSQNFQRRPPVDGKPPTRRPVLGYRQGVRPEQRFCDEVQAYLAYRGSAALI
ncbi:MAG: hypothetical protein AAF689_16430 [Pseudomonadota bacterium]